MCVCGQPATHDPRVNEFLVECHYCTTWYHGRCLHVNEVDAMEIVKLACPPCTKQGHTTVKYQDTAPMVDMDDISYAPLPSQRHRFDAAYSHAHAHASSSSSPSATYSFGSHYKKNTELFRRTLRAAVFARSGVRAISPHDFSPTYFKFHALDEPLLIVDANWSVAGLARALPVIGLQDVSALLTNTASTVRGLDVGSQESFKLSATGWQARLSHPAADAPLTAQFRVLETAFRHEVAPPLAVNEIDWNYLLPNSSGATNREANPECYGTLCGPGAFFDFSVAPDCKATWLAVSNGELDVFLIEPTGTTIDTFRDWKTDAKMPFSTVFLADRVDRCLKCTVKSDATLIVPSGWIYALYSEQGGSFFTGYFAHTLNLPTHLDVWQRLEGGDARFARHWQESSFAHGWALQHPSPAVAPAPPFNAQVWSLVCHYIHEFSHIDVLLRVSSLERDAMRRVLPLLRQWSTSPRAIERIDNVSWLPSSLQDGASLVDQLEQALMAHASDSAVASTSPASSKLGGHASLGPNESHYLYSGTSDDDMWSGANGVSSAFSSSHSAPSYHQESVSTGANAGLWDYPQYGGTHSHHGAGTAAHGMESLAHGGDSSPYYHHGHLADGQFSSALHYGATGGTQTYGGYMDPSHSPDGASHLGLGGHALMDLGGGLGSALHEVHMRHRASCHRCGNLRKKNVRCSKCPHIFCQKCAEKMVEEHSDSVFVDGCPVCKELCCCGKNRTLMCTRKFHCYKKCPSTKRQTN